MEILSSVNEQSAGVMFSRDELITVNNALNEVLNGSYAIDIEEFQTLMGVDREEAETLLRQVHGLLDLMRE